VVLVASVAVATIVFGVGLWIVDYASAGARAERAARDGRVGEALSQYARCGTDYHAAQLLAAVLPDWPNAQRALGDAFHELADLERLIGGARTVGVPSGLLDPLCREVAVTASALRHRADRLGVVAAAGRDGLERPDRIDQTVARIDQIAAALRAAHYGLVELTLVGDNAADSGRDETAAGVRLRALGEAARELALMQERR
jgi:hypothetical protein